MIEMMDEMMDDPEDFMRERAAARKRRDLNKLAKARAQGVGPRGDSVSFSLSSKRAAQLNKIHRKVNKFLRAAQFATEDAAAERNKSALAAAKRRKLEAAALGHSQHAEHLKKQLPPGYAMVFGKLRKITGAKKRGKLSR